MAGSGGRRISLRLQVLLVALNERLDDQIDSHLVNGFDIFRVAVAQRRLDGF